MVINKKIKILNTTIYYFNFKNVNQKSETHTEINSTKHQFEIKPLKPEYHYSEI